MGHDRPSNQFFLIIGWINTTTDDVFAYAADLQQAYDPHDWRSIRRFLDKLGVVYPESVWTELAYDAAAKNGCRVIRHLSDGTMRELLVV